METGDVYEFGPYPEAVYYMTDNMCISDQGVLFIHDGSHGGMIIVDTEGNVTKLDAYEGYRGAPIISSVSADGRYWVGYAVKAGRRRQCPLQSPAVDRRRAARTAVAGAQLPR